MNMQSEVICGYLVTEEQKRINAVYLDLVTEFGRLCEKAGITWWMYAGNLIGAVRHKGFVPWDDDIDIMLPRRDFDRLVSMTNEEFGAKPPYFLQNPVTDPGYVEALLRFRRSDTTFIADWNWPSVARCREGSPYNLGIDLSLFPIDNVPKSPRLYRLQSKAASLLTHAMYYAYGPMKDAPLHWALSQPPRLFGLRGYYALASAPYRMARKNCSGKVQIFGGHYSMCTEYDAADFEQTLHVPFEDITVPIPSGYDGILRATYGDYMSLPPEEDRHPPHDGIVSADMPYEETVRRLKDGSIPLPAGWKKPA